MVEKMGNNSEEKKSGPAFKPRKKGKKEKNKTAVIDKAAGNKEQDSTVVNKKENAENNEPVKTIDKKEDSTGAKVENDQPVKKTDNAGVQPGSAQRRRPNIAFLKQQAEMMRKQEEEVKAKREALKQKELDEARKQKEAAQKLEEEHRESAADKKEETIKDTKNDRRTVEERLKNLNLGNLRMRKMHKPVVQPKKDAVKSEKKEHKKDFFYKAPIVCILGHVDTGKTKILDKLRESNVQGGEAGGITQQIGATFFPYSELVNKTNTKFDFDNDVPGLLVIDTPGHETFANLRSRGSSMCDFAILVVDVLHALEKQTLESIELLKLRKTPFLIALNKIDRIYKWRSETGGFHNFDLQRQSSVTKAEFIEKSNHIILKFAEMGLNTRLFYENPDERKFINIIPTSAITGEGLSDLVNKIIELSSKYMKNKITFKDKMEATVLEVKNVEGIGITVDAIVSNGTLSENDRIVLCGMDGPIVTNVRSLLVPEPLKELRVKSVYKNIKCVKASLGIKIVANDLERTIAGSRILKITDYGSEEDAKQQVMEDIKELTNLEKVGIHLQASSLGSLEALIALVKNERIPVASVGIGKNLSRKDVLKMKAIKEKDAHVGIMLCFDTKIDKEMTDLAESQHIKIFEAQIIYNLIDKYKEYTENLISTNKKKNMAELIYPCKLQIIPEYVFTKRSPLVLGVEILEGKLKTNMPLFVMHQDEIVQIGKVTSMIMEKKSVDVADKGSKLSIKIETTDAPKLIGRDIKLTDLMYSTLTRKSIDVLKEFYKDEITDDAWRLVMDIKQFLGII
ncbi:Translation initiation factor 5B (eIF-5B) [Trachipleistophora hominis]|uniref:Eukaryotic translation initiation factor 5B n=1 Tax=Trachipleistophora hominis TaxID=72359 RepID=L7JUA4_TRAHO|nr:Translation initiation factor 5B (eIF-5B) [Trachipleistophora hominis]